MLESVFAAAKGNELHLIVAILVCLAGCAQTDPLGPDEPSGGLAQCVDPRPELCTQDYRPVCGVRDTGVRCVTTPCESVERRTYGNACSACSNPDVVAYAPGVCEE